MRLRFLLVSVVVLFCIPVQSASQSAAEPRVFVTDSYSWQRGGARPQTAEIMKTFRERCPDVVVTINKDNADFVILLDHEGGKGYARIDNKVAVFRNDGDMIYAGSTVVLGNAVKDACQAIRIARRSVSHGAERPSSESPEAISSNQQAEKMESVGAIAAPAQSALVYVFRGRNEGNSSKEPPVFINRRVIARMDNGRYIELSLPPGRYTFASNDTKKPSVTLVVEEGTAYFLEMKASFWGGVGHLRQVAEDEAEKQLFKLKPLSDKYVLDESLVISREY